MKAAAILPASIARGKRNGFIRVYTGVNQTRFRLLLAALLFPCLAWAASPAPGPASTSAFRAEFLANLDEVEDKFVRLATATPAEKFTWRPAPGVRSISEVYMHIAGSNVFLASFLGGPAPETNGDRETSITRKDEVIAELKQSFAHVRKVVRASDDLDKPVKLFGRPTTRRGVLLTLISHLHEHLGQEIAYARMNGVVPPWSPR